MPRALHVLFGARVVIIESGQNVIVGKTVRAIQDLDLIPILFRHLADLAGT